MIEAIELFDDALTAARIRSTEPTISTTIVNRIGPTILTVIQCDIELRSALLTLDRALDCGLEIAAI